ncbi:SpoIIIAH-like family protein [Peribacillus psychrosaccharolyticus]|uniref:SpoIIIAH-like family protein n=1 Tax=Peribacillus psychrosaccharolyticus TaxID=1407 RepID=A0A974NLJ2_PERPY|nr:SpoIIIAH-like family protein [Peribacillus psychrosaccharolyticus]MEC2056874.1 SpoIIIAH-like family protein [Peribacillus psychrosaccharolyticus]MED3746456.1 SpoIIIAH-like family protein [Peribacillus psychrosaccharolyticus]QQT00005.1 SpoIIIAH-like family protein [Peribacillus psychrosaccharolyticus]
MLLKKQTVWLLTMLSLVVVLSVYYLTSPEQQGTNMAVTEQEQEKEKDQAVEKAKESGSSEEKAQVTISSGDDEFAAMRIAIDEERSKQSEKYDAEMGKGDMSSEDINKAYDAIEQISEARISEEILETTIVSSLDLEAALVRIEGSDVNVLVKADELSKEAANEIVQLVDSEVKNAQNVVVEHQPKK